MAAIKVTVDELVASMHAVARLNSVQTNSLRTIFSTVREKGDGPALAIGMGANAWAESLLYPNAAGDSPASNGSVGLFQALKNGQNGAAGHLAPRDAPYPLQFGTSRGQPAPGDLRADPRFNTLLMFRDMTFSRRYTQYGSRSVKWELASGTPAGVAYSFAVNVERPANPVAKGVERAGFARIYFNKWADLPSSSLEWADAPPGKPTSALALVVLTLVLALPLLAGFLAFGPPLPRLLR